MNLSKLFEIQRQLDERIMEQHPELKGQNNLDWKILALKVELGECANEWRGFKKWSHDQYARTFRVINNKEYNPLLEEYVDCLHFILSIGLELGYDYETEKIEKYYSEEITHHFNETFWTVCELINTETITDWDYFYMFGHFLGLGEMLGFSWEQIEEAYVAKNAVNHERQESGY
jgi:dimeric dUTPase (all-alpha-NTP-PPase superfamily)